MPAIRNMQTAFVGGEQSTDMIGRVDLDQYRLGCRLMRNAIPLPQGGAKWRDGTRYIETLSATNDLIKIVEFAFNVDQYYLVVFLDLEIRVYQDDALIDTIASPYTAEQLNAIDTSQAADTMIITHEAHEPQQLVRVSVSDFDLELLDLFNPPEFNFNDANSPSSIDEIQTLKIRSMDDDEQYFVELSGFETESISYTYLNADFNADRIKAALEKLQIIPSGSIITVENPFGRRTAELTAVISAGQITGITVDSGGQYLSPVGSITIIGDGIDAAATINWGGANINEFFIDSITMTNNGSGYTEAVATATVAQLADGSDDYTVTFGGAAAQDWPGLLGRPADPASNATVTSTTEQNGSDKNEPAWSILRGWPKVSSFFESRLFLAATSSLPQTIWGSRTGDFFNFGIGLGDATDALESTIATDEINEIKYLISSRQLQVFTAGGEHYCPASPITPSNFPLPQQTNNGVKKVKPVKVDGGTYFLQSTGGVLREFLFSKETDESMNAFNMSLLAPHLLPDPISMTTQQGAGSGDANYIYVVNGNGNISCFSLLRNEKVQAWSSWDTSAGDFTAIGQTNEIVYATIFNAQGLHLVKLDPLLDTDLAVTVTDSNMIPANPAITEGIAKADGYYLGEVTSGETLEQLFDYDETFNLIEYGAAYERRITPHDLAIMTKAGTYLNKKQRIHGCYVGLNGAIGVELEYLGRLYNVGYRPDWDVPPQPIIGDFRIRLLGYQERGNVSIVCNYPYSGSVVAITQESKV